MIRTAWPTAMASRGAAFPAGPGRQARETTRRSATAAFPSTPAAAAASRRPATRPDATSHTVTTPASPPAATHWPHQHCCRVAAPRPADLP
jgi:hypothetical protein